MKQTAKITATTNNHTSSDSCEDAPLWASPDEIDLFGFDQTDPHRNTDRTQAAACLVEMDRLGSCPEELVWDAANCLMHNGALEDWARRSCEAADEDDTLQDDIVQVYFDYLLDVVSEAREILVARGELPDGSEQY